MALWRLRGTPLKRGDVLRTHPRAGYWGCAIVLDSIGETRESHARCLLALTPWVFEHEYGFDELDPDRFEILEQSEGPALRIYTCKRLVGVTRIGRFDLRGMDLPPVSYEPKPWRPLCGPLDEHVGSEAVWAWRRVHDSERLEAEIAAVKENDRQRRLERLAARRPRRGTRDDSPISALTSPPGELWVGFRVAAEPESRTATVVAELVKSLTTVLERNAVGKWVGQSSGGRQFEVTFEVVDRAHARGFVAEFLARESPEQDFWISSDYELIFEV